MNIAAPRISDVSGAAIVGMFCKCSPAQNKAMLAVTWISVLVGHNNKKNV